MIAAHESTSWLVAQQGSGAGPLFVIPIFAVVIVVVIVLVITSNRAAKKRRDAMCAALDHRGLLVAPGDDPGMRGSLSHLPEFKRGRQSLRWHAAAKDGSGLIVMEHEAVVGSGKHRQTIVHTVAALPCPPDWPNLTLGPESFFSKLGEMLGFKDLKLDDAAFNARWRIKCSSEEFAIVALSPAAQAWLLAAPKQEAWCIGSGWVCCVWDGHHEPAAVADLIARPAELLKQMPPELAAWRGAQSTRRPI